MPGNVTNSSVTGVLPWSLSASFTESREWPVLISEYPDGSSQRQEQAGTSRKSYQLAKRLTATQLSTLRAFWLSHLGKAFKVYRSQADHDATNSNFKLMRFEGGWSEEIGIGRSDTSITLVEVA